MAVEDRGRVARLTLRGNDGMLNLIPVYLDPSSAQVQIDGIGSIKKLLLAGAHNLIAGDWNFVVAAGDCITKNTAAAARSGACDYE